MSKFKVLVLLTIALPVYAGLTLNQGGLKPEDQKFYKNDSNAGNNQFERIDSAVREINKLHGKINSLESDVAYLKKEVELLKEKKK